jgi:ribosomal protein S18 acetylase RimI-like enzyme
MNPINDLLLVRDLYESAFSFNERRKFEELLRIATTKSSFHSDILKQRDEIIGFIFYWTFSDFIYIEHFAIAVSFRGQGYGKSCIGKLCQKSPLPIVLEVEKPETEDNRRRIRFYDNLGFKLSTISYTQPAYSADKHAVSMFIMHKGIFCEKFIAQIKKEVYNVCE